MDAWAKKKAAEGSILGLSLRMESVLWRTERFLIDVRWKTPLRKMAVVYFANFFLILVCFSWRPKAWDIFKTPAHHLIGITYNWQHYGRTAWCSGLAFPQTCASKFVVSLFDFDRNIIKLCLTEEGDVILYWYCFCFMFETKYLDLYLLSWTIHFKCGDILYKN